MCTCITYLNNDFYFGRNLDLDCSFGETVTITPRSFPFIFRKAERQDHHYAMIGMASANDSFPLYAEAVNEKGLAMAGLNFPGNAFYQQPDGKGLEIASFEVIAWLLGKCASVTEAEEYLEPDQYEVKYDNRTSLREIFSDMERCLYTYDFGDNWEHEILLEKVIKDSHNRFPVLLEREGERPPEDVGGPTGFKEYLRVISDPESPEYESMAAWSEITKAKKRTVEEINRSLRYYH